MRSNDRTGFTLTEMLVVISIIGIGAAMTLALGAGFVGGNTLNQATRMTQAYLMEARSRAIATRLHTSVVLYRDDNLAVMTDEHWIPHGQPLTIPEPCYYYIHSSREYIPAGWGINKIAPPYNIQTITFEANGSALQNYPAAYHWYYQNRIRVGAILVNIRDPLQRDKVAGTVESDDGDTVSLRGAWFPIQSKGYVIINGELVSYQGLRWAGSGIKELKSIERNVFGSGTTGAKLSGTAYPTGYCGLLMVVGATGHVVNVVK